MTTHIASVFNPLAQPTARSNAWPAPKPYDNESGAWHDAMLQASADMGVAWRSDSDDDSVAYRHGWGIFECNDRGHGPFEIQMDDEQDMFADDHGAWLHVYLHAAHPGGDFEYSMLCRRALATIRVHNRPEWDAILEVVSEHLLGEMLLTMAYEP